MPYLHWFKRLRRQMKTLSPETAKKVCDLVFTRLVEELARAKEPWRRIDRFGLSGQHSLMPGNGSSTLANLQGIQYEINAQASRRAIERSDPSAWSGRAAAVLADMGVEYDGDDPSFNGLCVELTKLEAMYWAALSARTKGDFRTEEEFIGYYKSQGYSLINGREDANAGPTLSEAWTAYAAEKTVAKPSTDWTPKTAAGYSATFDDFVEIVGNIRVAVVSRDVVMRYLTTLSRLPKNRKKHYPSKSVTDLLTMEIPESLRPSERTVSDKLMQVGSFLKWCRLSRGWLEKDPTEGVTVRVESRSYAPFTNTDLQALFSSKEYRTNGHSTSWRFWVPLIALYTGARLGEIAQLSIVNVVQEEGIWIFSMTDQGDGQRIKTKAGIRKVPISRKLIDIGLIEYVEELRSTSEVRLLPDIPDDDTRPKTEKISRWFNEVYKISCGIQPDPTGARKVFHSFRHTAITKATGAGIAIQHCQQVFGHEKTMMGETATYTHAFPIATLVPVIDSLTFGLDHSAIEGAWKRYVGGCA